MTPEVLLELEAQMGVVSRRLRRAVTERAAAIDPALGPLAYGVIDYLSRNHRCRQTDLVAALASEKGAISRAVQQLVDLGLAARVADPDDRRAHLVGITAEGSTRLAEVVEARRAANARRLADWEPQELEAFVSALGRYNASLEGAVATLR